MVALRLCLYSDAARDAVPYSQLFYKNQPLFHRGRLAPVDNE
jgi:hypothetical protein